MLKTKKYVSKNFILLSTDPIGIAVLDFMVHRTKLSNVISI